MQCAAITGIGIKGLTQHQCGMSSAREDTAPRTLLKNTFGFGDTPAAVVLRAADSVLRPMPHDTVPVRSEHRLAEPESKSRLALDPLAQNGVIHPSRSEA